MVKDCNVTGKICVHCGEKDKHHRTLCTKKFKNKEERKESNTFITNDTTSEEISNEETTMLSAGEQVVMQTALVEAMSTNHLKTEATRVLMDTGSSRTYITEEIARKLGLESKESNDLTVFTFGVSKPKEVKSPVVTLTLKSKYGNTITVKANVVPKISGNIQRMPVKLKNRFLIQKRFKLADTLPEKTESSAIGILIGSDYYNEVMSTERVEIDDGLYLIKSKFGWILSGKTKSSCTHPDNSMFVMTHTSSRVLSELHHLSSADESLPTPPDVDQFWKLETIGIKPPDDNTDDEVAMEHFKNTIQKAEERYQVAWPWRNENCNLPQNYELSMGRLKSLYKRLQGEPELLQQYNDIILNQLEKNMIEVVEDHTEQSNRRHYIPHHAVIKPSSNTTKVRVVYDASAKSKKSSNSLNECLHRGPVIMEDVCGLLMRFRTRKIGIVADIEKAFLQIGLQPKERDVTRFLWLKDINTPPTLDNIITYRFTRVPWGIVSSPFLLGATIKHHLEQTNGVDGVDISKDFYVDNLISGADCEEDAEQMYQSTKRKFKEISMNLREWKSNSNTLNQIFNKDEMNGTTVKVLGLHWDTVTDKLAIPTEKFDGLMLPRKDKY